MNTLEVTAAPPHLICCRAFSLSYQILSSRNSKSPDGQLVSSLFMYSMQLMNSSRMEQISTRVLSLELEIDTKSIRSWRSDPHLPVPLSIRLKQSVSSEAANCTKSSTRPNWTSDILTDFGNGGQMVNFVQKLRSLSKSDKEKKVCYMLTHVWDLFHQKHV